MLQHLSNTFNYHNKYYVSSNSVNTTEKVEVSKDATFNTEVPTTTKLNEAVSNAKNAGVTVNETSLI